MPEQATLDAAQHPDGEVVLHLVHALCDHSELTITRLQDNGQSFMVAVRPRGHAPLWWYGVGTNLHDALERAAEKARRYGFLKVAHG